MVSDILRDWLALIGSIPDTGTTVGAAPNVRAEQLNHAKAFLRKAFAYVTSADANLVAERRREATIQPAADPSGRITLRECTSGSRPDDVVLTG